MPEPAATTVPARRWLLPVGVPLPRSPAECYVLSRRPTATAQPASPLDVRPGVLPLLDIDAALARLPAEQRAKVAWAKAPALDALSRLGSEVLTDDLLDVAKAFAKPLMAVTSALWEALATREAWQSELEASFRDDIALMSQFFGDREDTQDTLDWCLGFVRQLAELTSMVSTHVLGSEDDAETLDAARLRSLR